MDEPAAWLSQARADRLAAERFVTDDDGTAPCHAIAKWQQTVEKAVKAVVSALQGAGISRVGISAKHEVAPYIKILIRLPRDEDNKSNQKRLYGILDQKTQAGIIALDSLVPRLPPRRNTEYPFQDAHGKWSFPAAKDVFSPAGVQQFRALAHRVLVGAEEIVYAIRRRPK